MSGLVNDPVYIQSPTERSSMRWLAHLAKVLEEDAKLELEQAGLWDLYYPAIPAMVIRGCRSADANIHGLGTMGVCLRVEVVPEAGKIIVHIHECYDELLSPGKPTVQAELIRITVGRVTPEDRKLVAEDHSKLLQETRERFIWYRMKSKVNDKIYPCPHVFAFANMLNDSRMYSLQLIRSSISRPEPGMGEGETFKFTAASALRVVDVEFNCVLAQERFKVFSDRALGRTTGGRDVPRG